MEEILKAIASGLKLDAEQFLADFKQGEDFMPEKEVAAKLATFIPDKVKAANETAKKVGRSEVQKRFSRIIKDSGFENPEALEGEPLLSAFVEWKGESAAHIEGDPAKLSKEELLKVPLVQSIVKEREAKVKEGFATERQALQQEIEKSANTEKQILLDKKILSIGSKNKVYFGEGDIFEERLSAIRAKIPLSKVQKKGSDDVEFLGDDGFADEGYFENVVTKSANAYGWIVTQDKNKGGSGAQGSGAAGADRKDKSWHFTPATTQREFDAQVMAAEPKDRPEMKKAFLEQQQKQAAG